MIIVAKCALKVQGKIVLPNRSLEVSDKIAETLINFGVAKKAENQKKAK